MLILNTPVSEDLEASVLGLSSQEVLLVCSTSVLNLRDKLSPSVCVISDTLSQVLRFVALLQSL